MKLLMIAFFAFSLCLRKDKKLKINIFGFCFPKRVDANCISHDQVLKDLPEPLKEGENFTMSSEIFDALTIFQSDFNNFVQQCSLVSYVSLPKRSLQYNVQFSFYGPKYDLFSFFHEKNVQKGTVKLFLKVQCQFFFRTVLISTFSITSQKKTEV